MILAQLGDTASTASPWILLIAGVTALGGLGVFFRAYMERDVTAANATQTTWAAYGEALEDLRAELAEVRGRVSTLEKDLADRDRLIGQARLGVGLLTDQHRTGIARYMKCVI